MLQKLKKLVSKDERNEFELLKAVNEREEADRVRYAESLATGKDKLILNYTGEWTEIGIRSSEGRIMTHGELWDLLSKYKMMQLLSNVSDKDGNCLLHRGSTKLNRCLVLGCDWGHDWSAIEPHFNEVHGIEATEDSAKKGIKNGKKIIWARMETMPYEDEHFDVIISRHVLEHTNDAQSLIHQIKRVLKFGGYSIHTLPCTMDQYVPDITDIHKTVMSASQWQTAFESSGLHTINTFYQWNHDQEDWTIISKKVG